MSKIQALLQQAAVIRDATTAKENTAQRIGSMFVSFIQALIDTLPKVLIDATAINYEVSSSNLIITFRTRDGEGELGTQQVIIPSVSTESAGLMTPDKLKEINHALDDIDSALKSIESAISKADTAQSTAASAKSTAEAAKLVTDTKGLPGGLATLDDDGLISSSQIPAYLDDVVEFDGFLSSRNPQILSASTTDPTNIVFISYSGTFAAFVHKLGDPITNDKFYSNWNDADKFGTASSRGRIPVAGKTYIDKSTDKQYRWNGEKLVELSAPMIETAWQDLVNLRTAQMLKPGCLYRITDYKTTVANDDEARSVGHPFDVVVLALGVDSLSERAWAMHSQRDADGYFADAKLQSWQLWYCLDNDTTRFQWADKENGRGVIYRMIDEWRNDCPYDFKNIQFKRYMTSGRFVDDIIQSADWEVLPYFLAAGMDEWSDMTKDNNLYEWYYTFSYQPTTDSVTDASMLNTVYNVVDCVYACRACNCNEMAPYYTFVAVDSEDKVVQALNNIVLTSNDEMNADSVNLYGNRWNAGCFNMTLQEHCSNNTFGSDCCNIIGLNFRTNTFGADCKYIRTSCKFKYNTFGIRCQYNTFGDWCQYNTLGADCSNNTFIYNCQGNTLGGRCCGNHLSAWCNDNSFGNECTNNSFGNYIAGVTVNAMVTKVKVSGGTYDKSVKNAVILSGTKGVGAAIDITFAANADYCQYAGLNSSGVLVVWTPADLV